ncbi:hypothetical protein T265_14459, partial [Opisthorchis viverrini]
MYGLLLEGLKEYLVREYGVELWQTAIQQVSGEVTGIQIKRAYPESLLPSIVKLVAKTTGRPEDEIYFAYGNFHKTFLSQMGYGRIIRVIANGFPQFINTLDDVHQNMQINYPRMRGPTFVVSATTNTTMEVTYSSKRDCYAQMVRGQLTAIATSLFGLDVDVELTGYEKVLSLNRYTYRITNKTGEWPPSYMTTTEMKMDTIAASHTFDESLLSFFQFHLLFTDNLKIVSLGKGYGEIKEVALGELLPDVFMLNRPKIGATFAEVVSMKQKIFFSVQQIKRHCHVTFELVLISDVGMNMDTEKERTVSKRTVTFRGQMLYVEECEMILFLGTPVIRDIKQLCQCGLYLSDFNFFDRRRDLIFGAEIAKFFNEAFDAVSICFTKVVDFDKKCMMMPVEELIYMLNKMYTIFDCLTESRNVYKVETIGGSYMFVSGAPQRTRLHAAHIAELALEMLSVTQNGFFWDTHGSGDTEPENKLEQVQLLFGCHTGSVVTGVLGHNAPRYCLFGDAVNTANRMMSTGLTAIPTGVQTLTMNSECKAIWRLQKRESSCPLDGNKYEEDSASKPLNRSLSGAVHLGVEKESSSIPLSHSLNKSIVRFLQRRQSKTMGDVFHTPSVQFETSLEATSQRNKKALLHSSENPAIENASLKVNASDHSVVHTKSHYAPLNPLKDSSGNTSKAALEKG